MLLTAYMYERVFFFGGFGGQAYKKSITINHTYDNPIHLSIVDRSIKKYKD